MSELRRIYAGVNFSLLTGLILFPLGEDIFSKTGPDGISIFFVSCIVSQLVYSGGASIFRGGVGSEMVLPIPLPSRLFSS